MGRKPLAKQNSEQKIKIRKSKWDLVLFTITGGRTRRFTMEKNEAEHAAQSIMHSKKWFSISTGDRDQYWVNPSKIEFVSISAAVPVKQNSDHPPFWQLTLRKLAKATTPEMYNSWIAPLEVQSLHDALITFKIPAPVFRSFLRANFERKISDALSSVTGKRFGVRYVEQ